MIDTEGLDLSLVRWDQRAAVIADEPQDCSFIMLDQPSGWQDKVKTQAQKDLLILRGRVRHAGAHLPFEEKVEHAIKIIKTAMSLGLTWAVSFSAGKDSTVVSHLVVDRLGLRLPHIMSNTRLEYPETVRQAARWKQWLTERDVVMHTAYPKDRAQDIWAKGIPLWSKEIGSKVRQFVATGNEAHLKRIPPYLHQAVRAIAKAKIRVAGAECCSALKKKPMLAMDKVLGIAGHFTGVRAAESEARKLSWLQRGSLYESARNKMWLCHPLSFWTKEDVLHYLEIHDIVVETPPRGSTGCVCCAFGAHLDQLKGRDNVFQDLYRDNPRMWAAVMDDWGYRRPLELAGIKIR